MWFKKNNQIELNAHVLYVDKTRPFSFSNKNCIFYSLNMYSFTVLKTKAC